MKLRALIVVMIAGCGGESRETRDWPIDDAGNLITSVDGGAPSAAQPVDGGVAVSADGGAPGLAFEQIDQCGADNPARLSSSEIAALQNVNAGPLKWLYPAAGTVFPRGLRAPLLMWETSADTRAVLVRITSKTFSYRGCLPADAKGRVKVPEDVWTKLSAHGNGLRDPFELEARELDKTGSMRGPATSRFVVAPGALKGAIYYNSYASVLASKAGAPGGAILRIRGGKDAEVFAGQRGCVGCHSVSANGARLVTSNLDGYNSEGVYALTPSTPINPPSLRAATDFVALSPDGTVYATGTSQYDGSPGGLFVTDTGARVENSGLPAEALHPMFSPTGSLLTFVKTTENLQVGTVNNELGLMDYDAQARRFTNYRTLLSSSDLQADWPNLLPDNRAVIYQEMSGRLLLVDVQNKRKVTLARALGYESAQAADRDTGANVQAASAHSAYYPTVVPVAVGGFFWVFFDSDRPYGNFDTRSLPVAPGLPVDPLLPPWLTDLFKPPVVGDSAKGLPSKQLWGAAIDISPDGSYSVDPSHPPFYLDGQEIGTNNHRAFAALDPCTQRGSSCQSGIDCCDGFCESGMCVAPPTRCARAEEACKTKSDCCDASNACINGFCSVVSIPLL